MTHVNDHCEMDDYTIATAERKAIERALAVTGGKKIQACKLLGTSLRTLQKRLSLYASQDKYTPRLCGAS